MPRAFVRAAVAGTALILASILGGGAASAIEVSGRLDLESRWYYQDGAHPGQKSQATGFVVEPKLYAEDDEARSVTLTPFFRYDGTDPRRTHFDVREAYLLVLGEIGDGEWELRLGGSGLLGSHGISPPGGYRQPDRRDRAPGRGSQTRAAHGSSHLFRRMGRRGNLRVAVSPGTHFPGPGRPPAQSVRGGRQAPIL